jgi:hypothetical protein
MAWWLALYLDFEVIDYTDLTDFEKEMRTKV